ncbi:MAG: RNA recognition motif domain-containing protein [Blastopirellula sp. JB062]
MGKKLYVGNLPYSYGSSELENLFGQHGQVATASVINDRETGRSRGFGFVEMATEGDAVAATEALNGFDVDGRKLVVNEARERERSGGGGGRGGYGGGGGRGGYGGGGGGYGGGGGRGGDRGGRGGDRW